MNLSRLRIVIKSHCYWIYVFTFSSTNYAVKYFVPYAMWEAKLSTSRLMSNSGRTTKCVCPENWISSPFMFWMTQYRATLLRSWAVFRIVDSKWMKVTWEVIISFGIWQNWTRHEHPTCVQSTLRPYHFYSVCGLSDSDNSACQHIHTQFTSTHMTTKIVTQLWYRRSST